MKSLKITPEIADRLSDRIVDAVNTELRAMREADDIQPATLFVGQLLGLMSILQSSPQEDRPPSLAALEKAAATCLHEILGNYYAA